MVEVPEFHSTLFVPGQVSAVSFSNEGSKLAVGSVDGCVRFYDLPDSKVKKAIRNIGDVVSSILLASRSNDTWIASGTDLLKFNLKDDGKLIYDKSNAVLVKAVCEGDEDAVNDIALNHNKSHIAFASDSGAVSVLEISSGTIHEMKKRHSSIAWTVGFVPDRPNELVSGGYDCTLLHFDYRQGTLLSSYEIPASPALAPGISSLPPFITAMKISPSGAIAAGTADGRIWLGCGGTKSSSAADKGKTKKSRKWMGLNEDESATEKVAEGLMSDIAFISPNQLFSCTVSGKLSLYNIVRPSSSENTPRQGQPGSRRMVLQESWMKRSETFAKVEKMAFSPPTQNAPRWLAIGGLHKDGVRGVVELWKLEGRSVSNESSQSSA